MGQSQSQEIQQIHYSKPLKSDPSILRNPKAINGLMSQPSKNINTLQDAWLSTQIKFAKNPCLSQIKKDNTYNTKTYEQVHTEAEEIASGLINLDLVHTISEYQNIDLSMVGIFAKNRAKWQIVDIGCAMLYGMTIIPLYQGLGPKNVQYCLELTNLSVIFVDSHCLNILLQTQELANLKTIITFDEITPEQQQKIDDRNLTTLSYEQIKAAGQKQIRAYNTLQGVNSESIFTFSFTSGTTGPPKAAMLSHRFFTSVLANFDNHDGMKLYEDDVLLSFMPLAHIFQRRVSIALLFKGGHIYFSCGDIHYFKEDLNRIRPTVLASVPRVYNRYYDEFMNDFHHSTGLKHQLIKQAIETKTHNLKEHNILCHKFYDRWVFKSIRENLFGGRIRLLITSSAPLCSYVQDFFKIAVSVPMIQCFGQTECGMVSATYDYDIKTGHVGGFVVGIEAKLKDIPEMNYFSTDKDENGVPTPRGEVCFRGPGIFSGYYKNQAKTDEAIDSEGWLHSGDIGMINSIDGSLSIIDRKKNIFKLSQGEYIAPEKIEACYLKALGVSEVFVYGDTIQSYLVGIVVPDKKYVQKLALELKLSDQLTFEQLCQEKQIREQINQNLFKTGKLNKLMGYEQLRNIHLEPVSLVVHGCMTSTLKLQRHKASKKFEKELESLYQEEKLV